MNNKTLIVGMGEVGKALYEVFKPFYPIGFVDTVFVPGIDEPYNLANIESADIIHIAFPYSETFIQDVKNYQEKYKPKYTIIHSTVPVGTSANLGASHSPIRGLHPNLESGIKTFVKFIGGEQASEVADYFRRVGLKVALFDRSETTEAMKLFDTEYYRACIQFAQRVKRYCDKNDLNFHEVYTLANQTYNEGYTKLDHLEFVRPVLQPIMQEIGGHCVIPNAELIKLSE